MFVSWNAYCWLALDCVCFGGFVLIDCVVYFVYACWFEFVCYDEVWVWCLFVASVGLLLFVYGGMLFGFDLMCLSVLVWLLYWLV